MPENTPASRDTNPNQVAEQIPHSGLHGERKVFDFGNTTLQEALDKGLIHTDVDEQGNPILVPNTINEHIDPTKTEPTEAHEPLTSIELVEKPKKKSLLVKLGSVVGAVVVGSGAILGVSAMHDDAPKSESTSVGADPGSQGNENQPGSDLATNEKSGDTEKDTNADPSIIVDVKKAPTKEQEQYVLNHPLTLGDVKYAEEALPLLGQRLNVTINGMIPNLDAPMGDFSLTAESQAKVDQLAATFIDANSPKHDALMASITQRGNQIGAMFMASSAAETTVSFLPLREEQTPLKPGETVTIPGNQIWTTNQPDTTTGDGRYNNDYSVDITLSVDKSGTIKLYSVSNSIDIGNVG